MVEMVHRQSFVMTGDTVTATLKPLFVTSPPFTTCAVVPFTEETTLFMKASFVVFRYISASTCRRRSKSENSSPRLNELVRSHFRFGLGRVLTVDSYSPK